MATQHNNNHEEGGLFSRTCLFFFASFCSLTLKRAINSLSQAECGTWLGSTYRHSCHCLSAISHSQSSSFSVKWRWFLRAFFIFLIFSNIVSAPLDFWYVAFFWLIFFWILPYYKILLPMKKNINTLSFKQISHQTSKSPLREIRGSGADGYHWAQSTRKGA